MTSGSSQLVRMMEIANLPTLPHILLQVLDRCNRDDASLTVIAEMISKDAALSSKVIGASNTAQLSRYNKFVSLEQSLAMLGLDMVKTITISSSFYQVFNNLSISPGFDLKGFWGKSLTSAFLAKLIAKEIAYPHLEEAYFTGLLLDIGQLVLWSNFPRQYATLLADKVDDITFMARESEQIGNNHCEVGAWLVNSWHLSSFIADAVLYHHLPQDQVADAHQLIQIAQMANRLAKIGADEADRLANGEKVLGITPERCQQIMENASELANNVAQSLGIEIDSARSGDGLQLEKTERDMRQQKTQLAMELRDNVLIGRNPLGAGLPVSLDDTLAAIQRSVQILFGFQDVVFFLPDQQGKMLQGRSLSGQGMLINEMVIPLNKKNSIVTDAFLSRMPHSSFTPGEDHISSILDQQIIRLMETEGFYCQPLFTQNSIAGIMLFGIFQTQLAYIKKQHKLLSMFAQQSAQAISLLNAFGEQETRIKSEMMASARTQTRQIAHEANNPLSIIKNYIQLLGVKLSKEDSAQTDLKIIQEEIDRVARILQTVSTATGSETALQENLNVNNVIQNLYQISFAALFARYQVSVETRFDPALPNIVTNKDKLVQILVNLMKNAAEAMQNGGVLLIFTRANVMYNGNEYVEIAFKDDGPGIPPEVMQNLFKPVASSKGADHMGLGLSIVKSTVDELNGRIFCRSNESSGTLFQVLLPRYAGKAI